MPNQRVDMIASGYSWTCKNPDCEHLNSECDEDDIAIHNCGKPKE